MRKRYKIFLISFIAILSCTFVRAQQHYTITNGLPSNTVYNSFRDSKGYIWFGTDKGVCRFDGKNFKTFTATDGLTDNSVIDFFEDASGRLWLFLVNGGNSFIYQDQVYNATNNRLLSKMPAIAFPRAMCSGKDSSIYIASNSGKIFKIKDTTFTTIINSYPNPFCAVKFDKDTLYACNQMLGMFKVHNDRLVQLQQYHYNLAYLADTNLILVFPGYLAVYRSGRIDTVYKDPSIQLANTVQIVAHDKNSFFYCTHNGLLLIDLTRHTQTWILQDMDVTSICKDIAGNYWVTTLSDGIYQLQSELSNVTFISNISNDKLIQRNDH
jgi:ligand-binding sensor domain-containing protein